MITPTSNKVIRRNALLIIVELGIVIAASFLLKELDYLVVVVDLSLL